jgi:hypothetical protein
MGLEFQFAAGLLALPLAGLPILLHLLFRRKSPVVPFPTLRFIRSSVQHTAARRRVRRWLLLACRALLLALLIWAIAQQTSKPSAAWAGSGRSSAAVIVLDTSYSMQLQERQTTLLNTAGVMVRDLLNGQLRGGKVAILRSSPPPADRPEAEELRLQETFRDSGGIRWSTPLPQAAPRPLVDRAAAAVGMLEKREADDKWLIIISDFQKREFPRQIPDLPGGRVVLIDLHPDDPRTAGITRVALDPAQPTPGANTESVVDIAGRPNDVRQVKVSVLPALGLPAVSLPNPSNGPLEDKARTPRAPSPANLDSSGHARLRFPLTVPARGWLQIDATLELQEPLAWARTRSFLLQVPPRQLVTLMGSPELRSILRPVRLGLDPSEGTAQAWALSVHDGNEVTADTNVVVLMLADWPDSGRAGKLLDFTRAGGTVIWFVRPGLEQTWAKLPAPQKDVLRELLPGTPSAESLTAPENTVGIATPSDPALAGLVDPRYQLDKVIVRRYMPIEAIEPQVTTLLKVFPETPAPGLRGHGLVFRKAVGAGNVFTIATLPDRQYTSLYLNPTFAPMLVQMSLRPPERSDAQNVEIGQPLVAAGPKFVGISDLRIQGPQNDISVVKPTADASLPGGRKFVFDRDDSPGLYTWRRSSDDAVLAMGNVQFPGAEAELTYTPAVNCAAPESKPVVARSTAELQSRFEALSQRKPRWTVPIGIVMVLMCVEAFIGSTAGVWKGANLRAFVSGVKTT